MSVTVGDFWVEYDSSLPPGGTWVTVVLTWVTPCLLTGGGLFCFVLFGSRNSDLLSLGPTTRRSSVFCRWYTSIISSHFCNFGQRCKTVRHPYVWPLKGLKGYLQVLVLSVHVDHYKLLWNLKVCTQFPSFSSRTPWTLIRPYNTLFLSFRSVSRGPCL